MIVPAGIVRVAGSLTFTNPLNKYFLFALNVLSVLMFPSSTSS